MQAQSGFLSAFGAGFFGAGLFGRSGFGSDLLGRSGLLGCSGDFCHNRNLLKVPEADQVFCVPDKGLKTENRYRTLR